MVKLIACFEQRAGSQIRNHEPRRWRMRKPFAVHSVHVDIAPETQFADVHTLVKAFQVVITIDDLRIETPLAELVALKTLGALGMVQAGTRYLITEQGTTGKKIGLELKLANPGYAGFLLTARNNQGRGFRVVLELHGYRV